MHEYTLELPTLGNAATSLVWPAIHYAFDVFVFFCTTYTICSNTWCTLFCLIRPFWTLPSLAACRPLQVLGPVAPVGTRASGPQKCSGLRPCWVSGLVAHLHGCTTYSTFYIKLHTCCDGNRWNVFFYLNATLELQRWLNVCPHNLPETIICTTPNILWWINLRCGFWKILKESKNPSYSATEYCKNVSKELI